MSLSKIIELQQLLLRLLEDYNTFIKVTEMPHGYSEAISNYCRSCKHLQYLMLPIQMSCCTLTTMGK
jgi:hypothetical protein